MRKRRTFDLDLPDVEPDAGLAPAPDSAPDSAQNSGQNSGQSSAPDSAAARGRRGPMAAAITETGASLAASATTLAAIRAENDALAEAHVRARRLGLLAEEVPLDTIDTTKLIRDRSRALFDDGSMAELIASIRDVGLSNPIRVESSPRGRFGGTVAAVAAEAAATAEAGGRYELIQGWRRLSAYRALLAETGDTATWGTIPAIVSAPGEDLGLLYRRMVDENLVRKDISFAEMAQLALSYAQDIGASQDPDITPEKAVALLFRSAGYQKRSYIRGFLPVVAQLGQILRFPEEIPRSLGLALAPLIEADDGTVGQVRTALKGWDNRSVADELAVLRRVAGLTAEGAAEPASPSRPDRPTPDKPRAAPAPGTTFRLRHPGHTGDVTCSAGDGRLELRLARDLTTLDRAQLEDAIRALLDRLG